MRIAGISTSDLGSLMPPKEWVGRTRKPSSSYGACARDVRETTEGTGSFPVRRQSTVGPPLGTAKSATVTPFPYYVSIHPTNRL